MKETGPISPQASAPKLQAQASAQHTQPQMLMENTSGKGVLGDDEYEDPRRKPKDDRDQKIEQLSIRARQAEQRLVQSRIDNEQLRNDNDRLREENFKLRQENKTLRKNVIMDLEESPDEYKPVIPPTILSE